MSEPRTTHRRRLDDSRRPVGVPGPNRRRRRQRQGPPSAEHRPQRAPAPHAKWEFVAALLRSRVVTPPMFAIPFGLVGLSGCWRALGTDWTTAVGDALVVTSALFVVLLTIPWCLQLVRRETTLWSELRDPARGPSVPVVAITAMLLTTAVAPRDGAGREVLVAGFAALTVAGGVAVVTAWLVTRLPLRSYHPGFYLPTAGGALLTSQCVAQLGWLTAAEALFYVGLASWLVLGVVTTLRLARTPLAPPLRPVMVIELAAPALASNTYLVVFGRFDGCLLVLSFATVLMAVLQVVLIPYLRRAQFGPASWSASFSYATAAALALRWIDHGQPAGAIWWRTLTMAVATAVVVQLSVATARAVRQGRFFPEHVARSSARADLVRRSHGHELERRP